MYIQKCIRPSRFFVNRILDLLRANYDTKSITLTHDFRRDIRWFKKFLGHFNGTAFYDHKPIQEILELDACLVGLGGRCDNKVYHLPIVKHYANLHITHLEMVNILVAIRVFGPSWFNKKVLVKCDNQAVVHVLNNGRTKDAFLAACVRNVWLEAALYDIQLLYRHIPGRQNTAANLLSRWENTPNQMRTLLDMISNPVWMVTGPHLLEINNDI